MSDREAPAHSLEVRVYRSAKRSQTYAYLPADAAFDELPDAFRNHFGEATEFLSFALHEDKVLAQADAKQVLQAIAEQGFYLQLPPPDPVVETSNG